MKKPPPGWTRLSRPGDKCGAHWRHESGWQAQHCGHPTANYPYILVSPGMHVVMSHNGMGWKRLEVCFEVVERLLTYKVEIDPVSHRVPTLTSSGEATP